jgi:2-methylisocitrate lyase-like PEP mutase family enzyme
MTTPAVERFHQLHESGTFILPNPWDVGSARILAGLGFPALATTSQGFAASLGRRDQNISVDELLAHVEAVVGAVDVPVNIDGENGFADSADGVAENVARFAATGAAGFSVEDWDPAAKALYPIDVAVERVAAAAKASGLVFTARAENHLRGVNDLDDTITRLRAYRDAGATAVYAPGLSSLDDIARLVEAVEVPVNVLALPGGPAVPELEKVGVRRVSIGSALAIAAYSTLVRGAQELLATGTSNYLTEQPVKPNPLSLLGPA